MTFTRTPENDFEFTETILTEVERAKEGGYYVTSQDGTMSIDDPGFVPAVGDVIRYYGRGLGYPVRGMLINGKLVYYRTPAEEKERHRQESAKFEAEVAAQKAAALASGRSEAAMREEEVPWPKTLAELNLYLAKLAEGPHTYGTCVYAVSLAATAAFHFMSGQLGITGFQASCADLDVIRRTRLIKGPFMLIKGEDAMYPQSNNVQEKLDKALHDWAPWLKDEAIKRLEEEKTAKYSAHPDVVAHWKQLAGV